MKHGVVDDGQFFKLNLAGIINNGFLMKFRGYDDRNTVTRLSGKLFNGDARRCMGQLPEGQYYVFDIIGLKVLMKPEPYLGDCLKDCFSHWE